MRAVSSLPSYVAAIIRAVLSTSEIIARIKAAGHAVTIHRVNGVIEMHAIPLNCESPPQIARCNDGDGPDEDHRCACLLAAAAGISVDKP